MRVDNYGQHIYSVDDLFEHYMKNPDSIVRSITLDDEVEFDSSLELNHQPRVHIYRESSLSVQDYDSLLQSNWHMPQRYRDLDIAAHVLDKCNCEAELQRVGQELLLYQERELFDLLRYLVYLVDTMREHGIVWGVGRGSSIASFVLYKLDVHRINSLVYDLDIREFFK